jgi:hypothetical protein
VIDLESQCNLLSQRDVHKSQCIIKRKICDGLRITMYNVLLQPSRWICDAIPPFTSLASPVRLAVAVAYRQTGNQRTMPIPMGVGTFLKKKV